MSQPGMCGCSILQTERANLWARSTYLEGDQYGSTPEEVCIY